MIRQKLPSVQYGSSSSAQLGGLFDDLIELAQIFGFTLTAEMLSRKSEQCSVQKDEIFRLKASKLREIGMQIG